MKTSDMPVIELSGTPRERGRCYGEAAKALITEVAKRWHADLGNYGRNSLTAQSEDPDTYLDGFLSETQYLHSIEKWTPDLLEEVKGIAEATGLDFKLILGLQLMDEEWVFGLRRRLEKPSNKCTAFAVPGQAGDTSYAGQNMDIMSWVDGKQVLLRVMPDNTGANNRDAPEALVFSKAGNIALNGVNARGLGITCNTLSQLNYSTKGLPVSFIVRAVLQQPTIDQAEAFLRSIEHASGQNFILSSPGDMRCFECCGTSVVRYQPDEFKGRVFHTNHPLVNQDISDVKGLAERASKNSQARMQSICNRLGDVSQRVSLADIKAALSAQDDPDNPVSRAQNKEGSSIGFTAGASIYELGTPPRLHLAAGPPSVTEFEVFEFKTAT